MKPARTQQLITCPCCKQVRSAKEHRYFTDTALDKYYTDSQGKQVEQVYWVDAKKDSLNWACDECLQNGKAIKGNPNRQLFCDFQPHFTYFDKPTICRDCNKEFIFSKEEQYHWYETLHFYVQSKRVRCNSCRDTKKLKDRLSFLLSNVDYNDLTKVEETINLRVARKEYQQAKEFIATAKKKHARKSAAFQILEQLSSKILEAERLSSSATP